MTNYDRVSVTVGVILTGIVLFLVLRIPTRAFEFYPLNTPLAFRVTGTWVLSLLLVGLSCAGTEAIMRTHPLVRQRIVRFTFPTWILPGLTSLALVQSLPRSPNLLYWLIGLAVGGGILAWLILGNYHALYADEHPTTAVQTGLAVSGYLLALVFFAVIYRTRMRSLVTATSVALVALLISLTILYSEKQSMRRVFLYCTVVGLILGETTWALNYWRANVLSVGVFLVLLFYVLIGIIREHIRDSLSWRVIVELLSVAVLGIWLAFRFGPTQ